MSGKVGNPYHDPSTGKFTSGSGLNVANSTRSQRLRGHAKTAAKAAGAFGVALAGAALGAVAHSALSGVTHVVKRAAAVKTAETIAKYAPRAEAHAAHVTAKTLQAWKIPTAASVKATTTTPAARATSLKSHIAKQHSLGPKSRPTTLPGTFPYRKG